MALLQRVIGTKKAREMWMLCRRYGAEEALKMGLVNVVVPLAKFDAEVRKWCYEILALSPTCLKILKTSFWCGVGIESTIIAMNGFTL